MAVFRNDIAIQRYLGWANRITPSSDFETGGHFAAMETPDLLAGGILAFFRTVRQHADPEANAGADHSKQVAELKRYRWKDDSYQPADHGVR